MLFTKDKGQTTTSRKLDDITTRREFVDDYVGKKKMKKNI